MNILYIKQKSGELKRVEAIPNMTVTYYGDNSIIIVGENFNANSLRVFMGNGGLLEIGDDFRARFSLSIDMKAENVTVKFGSRCNIGRGEILAGDDNNKEIIIGNDFLTSLDVYIRNSDGHVIIDKASGEVINKTDKGIYIGNHVWCGYDVKILKDVVIPDNVVIGTGAIVCKKQFEEYSVIGGVPAKTLRTNVEWKSQSYDNYIE